MTMANKEILERLKGIETINERLKEAYIYAVTLEFNMKKDKIKKSDGNYYIKRGGF